MKKILLFSLLLGILPLMSACETTSGMGEDIESTGDAIEDTTEDVIEETDEAL